MAVIPGYYSGTSNIVIPLKQSQFPPPFQGRSRLAYYASLYSSLEVNSSFYKIPKPATVAKWSQCVPAHFKFTFKVPKTVTHEKGLQFHVAEIEKFAEAAAQAGDHKGCLLVQLPPSVKSDRNEELEAILESLRDNARNWHLAVEFRDSSWYNSSVYRMLQHYRAGMVLQDMPKSATPQKIITEDFIYLRFHGPDGTYRGSYDAAFLAQHAKRIVDWLKGGKEVYVYFNNTMGDALGNLDTLNALVEEAFDKNSANR
jgi:uncharacterized protein YecE (DUF72 family)